MFSFSSSREHSIRRRLVAPAYSKLSISSLRTQSIIQHTLRKLVIYLQSQTDGQPVIVRNVFRALITDVFTAFAFSEMEGTIFLDKLRTGPNTMKDLGMDDFQLWHEDTRGSFFFFESQSEFKYLSHFFAPHCRQVHERFEAWITNIINRYEARVKEDESFPEHGVYWRLLAGKNSPTVENLGWRERASEIMDQMGKVSPVYFLWKIFTANLLEQVPVKTLWLACSNASWNSSLCIRLVKVNFARNSVRNCHPIRSIDVSPQ
jgi:hypothetical protein